MRAVVQRVTSANVEVEGKVVAEIGRGFLILVSVTRDDGDDDAAYMATKIAGLRIFNDDQGDMNLSLADVGGSILAISQFTLHGDARKGRRPSFFDAAPSQTAEPLFDRVVALLRREGIDVKAGVFGARMLVKLTNEGPVTILLDSRKSF